MSLPERWSRLLQDLHTAGRYRSLAAPAGVDLSSNDYLGYGGGNRLPLPPLDVQLSPSGGASRLLRGQHPIWEEVETALAAWHGAEAALVMTSGYVANEGLLSTVIQPDDWVASDAENHASIIDGLRLTRPERFLYAHRDLEHLESGLREVSRKRTPERQLFVVTESLFSMSGERAPLEELIRLTERYEAHVIVDEAHATGCFGATGSGLVDALGLRSRVLASVHTGGKALGVAGAYVCGSALLRELLVNRCRHFIFTTALPPLLGSYWLGALERVRGDTAGRSALSEAAAVLRGALDRFGIAPPGRDYLVPVVIGADSAAVSAAQRLQQRGYDIRAIRPPTVAPGTARLRVSVHADHEPALLEAVARAIAECLSPEAV